MFLQSKLSEHLVGDVLGRGDRETSRSTGDLPVADAAPFTLPHLISWLRTKPADGEYNFHNCEGFCLASQYAYAHGFNGKDPEIASLRFDANIGYSNTNVILSEHPWTFGAALERAEALLASGRTPLQRAIAYRDGAE
jgi:hypothetical protein